VNHAHQTTQVKAVKGIVTKKYIHIPLSTTWPFDACQSKRGIAKKVAMNVPGRNTMVTTASVFIDELSLLDSKAIDFEAFAMSMPML
jgi:hypothetical protein